MNISNHFCHEIMSCYLKGANGLMGRVSEGLSLSWCWTGHQMPNISSRRYLDKSEGSFLFDNEMLSYCAVILHVGM